jgi:hypothetical protein
LRPCMLARLVGLKFGGREAEEDDDEEEEDEDDS